HAGVVHQVARGEVVGAVDDDVVRLQDLQRVGRRQLRLVQLDAHAGVDRLQPITGRLQLGPAHVGGAVQHLALQVAEVDDVEVDGAEAPAAGRGGVQRGGRAGPAGADQQHGGGLEALLPLQPDLGHDEVAAVALHLLRGQGGGAGAGGERVEWRSHKY